MVSPATAQELYKTDVTLCYPFIEAMVNTLKTQCSIAAKAGKPAFKEIQTEDRVEVFISATITTSTLLGSVTICFGKRIFLLLMGKMLGESYATITPELEDGAKELMNIVFNQAKKPLAVKGMAAIRSIPTIVFGENIRVRYLSRNQTIVLPFDTDIGPFSIEITTQEVSTSDKV